MSTRTARTKAKVLWQWHAVWIGVHYSAFNRRVCLNVIPFLTLCIVFRGGIEP